MAYGHYWYGQIELSEELLSDLTSLLLAAEVEIAGWNGEGLPELTEQHVRFNGSRELEEDAECLSIYAGLNDGSCETAVQAYDSLVAAVLLRVLRYNPQLNIESDGQWRDWDDACNLYLRVFDELPPRPQRIAA
jgi:hypothetical protein